MLDLPDIEQPPSSKPANRRRPGVEMNQPPSQFSAQYPQPPVQYAFPTNPYSGPQHVPAQYPYHQQTSGQQQYFQALPSAAQQPRRRPSRPQAQQPRAPSRRQSSSQQQQVQQLPRQRTPPQISRDTSASNGSSPDNEGSAEHGLGLPGVEDDEQELGNGQDDEAYGTGHTVDEEGRAVFHLPPPPQNTYDDEASLERAIHAWSMEHGYELVRRASKKNAKGDLYKRYYHCSKHGQRMNTGKLTEQTRKRANRKTNRTDCPMSIACVAVEPTNPEGQWQVRHRKTHHNHGPLDPKTLAGHRRRARMGEVEKAVDGLFSIGTPTAQVMQFLQKTNPNGLFTRTDVANMKLKWKKWGTCGDRLRHDSRTSRGFPSACTPCRQKKQGCDKGRPTCENCAQSGATCIYDTPDPVTNMDNVQVLDTETFMQVDDPSMSSQPQQHQSRAAESIGPTANVRPADRRGHPSVQQAATTEQILANLQSFQASHITSQRLTLQSSSVEILAHSSCGNGDSFRNLPHLYNDRDWPNFRNRMKEAAMRENTIDVLNGCKVEPTKPVDVAAAEVDVWNEYIKQLAIFNRRNDLQLSAILENLAPNFRHRVQSCTTAHAAWNQLEEVCQPRGSETAFKLYSELHSTTLQACSGLRDYILRLTNAYEQFKKLKLNTTPPLSHLRRENLSTARFGQDAMPEEMVCFLFLRGLGEEWQRWVEGLVATNNVGGFGTGERLGLKELCKRAEGYEAMQRRELGRSRAGS